MKKIFLLLLLGLQFVLAQTVPAPKQPEEPRQNLSLLAEVTINNKVAENLVLQILPGLQNPNKLLRFKQTTNNQGVATWELPTGDWLFSYKNEKNQLSITFPIQSEYLENAIKIGPYEIVLHKDGLLK